MQTTDRQNTLRKEARWDGRRLIQVIAKGVMIGRTQSACGVADNAVYILGVIDWQPL